mmetsp:Transcript_139361/g.277909  ORF Transcript_139361/g.277909 Transcript_139361/m.277909 type:complete len:271 (-) Transcript_139361:76-888(-)
MAAAPAFDMSLPLGAMRPLHRSRPLQPGPPAVGWFPFAAATSSPKHTPTSGAKRSSVADDIKCATQGPAAALALLSAVVVAPMRHRKRGAARCVQAKMETVTPKIHMPQPLAQGLQTRLTVLGVGAGGCRSSHVLRAYYDDDAEDGPDSFFARKKMWKRKAVPAWTRNTSKSKVDINEKAVFFFPAFDRKCPEEKSGWVNARMYRRRTLPKRLLRRARRDRKRAWRKLSVRLREEYRYKRYPRDESGQIIQGTWGNKRHPFAIRMRSRGA